MTPTEQDKELRESTRKSIALLIAQRRGAVKWDEKDYIAAGNILFVCTKLITDYTDKKVREARIDEVHNFGNWNADKGHADLFDAIDARLAQLKESEEK